MMKFINRKSFQIPLVISTFLIALGFRLIRAGVAPLTTMEAEIALQALSISRGTHVVFGPHMAVVGLTGFDFLILNPSNFLARFWPGVFGALIVFVPFLFRNRIGLWPASGLSLILAISPEMVGLSRIIGSPMAAMVFVLLTLGFFVNRKPIMTGIALGLGLMSGPGFWMGVAIIALSVLIFRLLFTGIEIQKILPLTQKRAYWVRFGIACLTTLFLVGTSFFMAPSGLSGIFSGFVAFAQGFRQTSNSPFVLMPLSLFVYSFGALIFGIWGSIRGVVAGSKTDIYLLIWWLVALIFVLIYPGSHPADLIWVTLPLGILSVRAIFYAWGLPDSDRAVTAVTSIFLIFIFVFIILAIRSLFFQGFNSGQQLNVLIAMIGGVVLILAVILLVSFGWSQEHALSGLLLGLSVFLLAGMLSLSVNVTGLGSESTNELWYPDEPVITTKWMHLSIDRVLRWNAKRIEPVEIVVSGFDTASMRWALRDYEQVIFVSHVIPQSQPGILITDILAVPEISSSYRGQDLVWSQKVDWEDMSPLALLNWVIERKAPFNVAEMILWVRTDLMPDAQFSP